MQIFYLALIFGVLAGGLVPARAMAQPLSILSALPQIEGAEVQLYAPEVLILKGKLARSVLLTLRGASIADRGSCGIAYLYKNGLQERSHRICPPTDCDGDRYEAVFQPEVSPEDGDNIQWRAYFLINGKITPPTEASSQIRKLTEN